MDQHHSASLEEHFCAGQRWTIPQAKNGSPHREVDSCGRGFLKASRTLRLKWRKLSIPQARQSIVRRRLLQPSVAIDPTNVATSLPRPLDEHPNGATRTRSSTARSANGRRAPLPGCESDAARAAAMWTNRPPQLVASSLPSTRLAENVKGSLGRVLSASWSWFLVVR